MSDDLRQLGVLNENYRISAAFTRERLRGLKPTAATPGPASSVDSDAEPIDEPGSARPGPGKPPNCLPPSGS